MSNGKGDAPRPLSVPREEYEQAYDRIFGVHEDDFSNLEHLEAAKKPIRYKCHACGDYVTQKGCELKDCEIRE